MSNNIPSGYCDSSCTIEKAERTRKMESVQRVKFRNSQGDIIYD
ncbi:MAG TPA: hypothetical protein VK436_13330 [Methanocella sp.]|nr:hypothetical protein [Methanocella sp.]